MRGNSLVMCMLVLANYAQCAPANAMQEGSGTPVSTTQRKQLQAGDCRFTIQEKDGPKRIVDDPQNKRKVLTWELPKINGRSGALSLDMRCEAREAIDDEVMNALLEHRQPTQQELRFSELIDTTDNDGKVNFTSIQLETPSNLGAAYTYDYPFGDEERRTRALVFCIASRNSPERFLCGNTTVRRLVNPSSDVTEAALQHLKEIEFLYPAMSSPSLPGEFQPEPRLFELDRPVYNFGSCRIKFNGLEGKVFLTHAEPKRWSRPPARWEEHGLNLAMACFDAEDQASIDAYLGAKNVRGTWRPAPRAALDCFDATGCREGNRRSFAQDEYLQVTRLTGVNASGIGIMTDQVAKEAGIRSRVFRFCMFYKGKAWCGGAPVEERESQTPSYGIAHFRLMEVIRFAEFLDEGEPAYPPNAKSPAELAEETAAASAEAVLEQAVYEASHTNKKL